MIRPDRSGKLEPSERSTSYMRTYGDSSTSSVWRLGSLTTSGIGCGSGPASSSRTCRAGSSDRRAAMTQPAVPPPTTMTS